jgi:hypothetical protein
VARVGDCSWPPPGDCEGFLCLPRRSVKGTLVDCSCHLATSLVSRFLWCPRVGRGSCYTLSRRTTKYWSIQRGLACQQAHEPREKNLVFILCMIGFFPVIGIHLIVIGSFLDAVV